MAALLETQGLQAFYGDFQALFGIDVTLNAGETVAILGANGAGKSTLLRSIVGLLAAAADQVLLRGEPIGGLSADKIVARGIALVPEGRRLFPSLTVEENLLMGGSAGRVGPWSLERVFGLFPVLRERRNAPATALSGGQQQMAAIGRALLANPQVLLCDEISLGLAPSVVGDVYAALPAIKEQGTAVMLVEQDINRALEAADRAYCLMAGRVSLSGSPDTMTRAQIRAAYFGM